MPKIILLNGPGGAGKSTVAKLLAKKLSKSAVIEVDELRLMVKNGLVSPFEPKGYDQLVLSTRNAALLAKNFVKENFNVIIDECVAGKKRFDLYLKLLSQYDLITVLLLPNKKVLKYRDGKRTGAAFMGKKTLTLHEVFSKRNLDEKRWTLIDNSKHTPTQTVNAIYKLL